MAAVKKVTLSMFLIFFLRTQLIRYHSFFYKISYSHFSTHLKNVFTVIEPKTFASGSDIPFLQLS